MLSRNEVKYIQSLYYKKNSSDNEFFIVEGVKLLYEILNSDFAVQNVYALKSWIEENSEVENVIEVSEAELKRISNFETPNKALAVVRKKISKQIPDLKNKITLVLDGIQDPKNLGTIIRTADWFDVENIIASNDTADVYNSKVIQATMGSFIRVPVFYTDLKAFLSTNTIKVYGAMLNGENITAALQVNEGLLVVGNESKGIRSNITAYIDKKISIPAFGKAESLNAAVATGIILWRLKRQ